MTDFLERVNKKRKKYLFFLMLGIAFKVIAFCLLLILNNSAETTADPAQIIAVSMFIFLAVGIAVQIFFTRPAYKKYNSDFTENIMHEAFLAVYGNADDGDMSVKTISGAELIKVPENAKLHHNIKFSYDTFEVCVSQLWAENGFSGIAMTFDCDREFRYHVQVRSKGASLTTPPEEFSEEGFGFYTSISERFNSLFKIVAKSEKEGRATVCENTIQSFLRLGERSHGKLHVDMNGKRMTVLLSGVGLYYTLPVFIPITPRSLERMLMKDVSAVLSFANELYLEEKIWLMK